MAEQTKKIAFTTNTRDDRSGVAGYAGEEKTVLATVADRFILGGVAVELDEEALEEKSVEELKADADALGVDLSGKKGSKKEIISAIKEGE